MRSEGSASNRAKWGGAIGAGMAVVLLIAIGAWLAGRGEPERAPAIAFTPVAEEPTRPAPPATPSPPDRRPPSTPVQPGEATPAASPGATPTTPAARGIPPGACADGCLLRMPRDQATTAILDQAGMRPSYEADEWVWAVVPREVAEAVAATGGETYLVADSPDTLALYATRFPDGMRESAALDAFGTVLDAVGAHRIIEVPSVPPVVDDIVAERIWIEKVRPATASGQAAASPATRVALADIEIGGLMSEVDADAMLATITDLQATSSTDGTGVGTRQYSQPGNVMATEYLFRRLESYGLEVWYEDFITWDGYLVSNVVAEIPGRDESMIYGVMAHLDSTAESFAEAPGADDNATGVAGALEIARILAGYELAHPVHIIFVNAEETAIIGSMAYAANVVDEGVPIEGVFNMDTIGNDTYGTRLIVNSGPRSSWMTDLLIRINDGYGLGQEIWARQNGAIVADDNMLRNQGIEAVLVARVMADDYTVHHTAADTVGNFSMDNAVTATMLVLLSIAALCQ